MDLEALKELLKDVGKNIIDEDHINSYSILMAMAVAAEEKAFNKQPNSDSLLCAPPSVDLIYGELRNFVENTLKSLYLFNETYLKDSSNPDWDFKIQSEILYLMLGARDILKNIINKNVTRLKAFAVRYQVPVSETKASLKENDSGPLSSSTIQNSGNDGTDSKHMKAEKPTSPPQKEFNDDTQNFMNSKSCLPNDTIHPESDKVHLEEDYKDHNDMKRKFDVETALSFSDEMTKFKYFDESEGVDDKKSVVAHDGQTSFIDLTTEEADTNIHSVESNVPSHPSSDSANIEDRLRNSDEAQQTFEGYCHPTVQELNVDGGQDRENENKSASSKSSNSSHSDEFDSVRRDTSPARGTPEDEHFQSEFEESQESSSSEHVGQPTESLQRASTKSLDGCSDNDADTYSEDSTTSSLKSDVINGLSDLAATLFRASRIYNENCSNSNCETTTTTTKIEETSEQDNVNEKVDMAFMKNRLRSKNRSLWKTSFNSKSTSVTESISDDDDEATLTGNYVKRRRRWMYDAPSQEPLPCSSKTSVGTYHDEESTEMPLAGNSGALERNVRLSSSADEADPRTITSEKKRKRLSTVLIKRKKKKKKKSLQEVNGRRNIRVIMNEKDLLEQTRKAGEEEETRKKRIEERQALLDGVSQLEDTSDASAKKLVLDYDDEKKQELVTVDPDLLKILKPFQVSGVRFMWNACFESLQHIADGGEGGCILAHCMGLGKTLQVITLVHTLFAHKDTKVNTVLVICPYNTVSNWKNEFDKWLKDDDKIDCYNLHNEKKYKTRFSCLAQWAANGGVMIIGYELFRKLVDHGALISSMLLDPGPDLVVCDEGHVLKNDKSDISKAIMQIRTNRRIVLTGTPFQNSLNEYYCMIKFIKPNLLGNRKEFQNRFINPITNGRYKDSKLEDVQLMRGQSYVLHRMLSGVLQRLDYTELKPFLEPKFEFAIFFRMSDLQSKLYQYYIEKRSRIGFAKALFSDYPKLRLLWTHPLVLRFSAIRNQKGKEREYDEEQIQGTTNQWWDNTDTNDLFVGKNLKDPSHDPKLISFFTILEECQERKEKLLVFSSSLATLDMIEHFLRRKGTDIRNDNWKKGHDYLRLDGDTSHELRSKYCEIFNDADNARSRLFLISTRAGGLGINLTGANRVIIYDVSWNPADDLQSIFRVYRLPQKKPCYIYRFVAEGTMEEKIYERQITKLSVAYRVVDEKQIQRHYLRKGIKELYTFKPKESTGIPHKLPEDHVLSVLLQRYGDLIIKYEEHDALLENLVDEKLTEGEQKAAWEKYENILFNQSQVHNETISNSENQEPDAFADQSNISDQNDESLPTRTSGEILPELIGEVNETSTSETVLISADETDASSSGISEADDDLEDSQDSSSDDEFIQHYAEIRENPSQQTQSPVFNSETMHGTSNQRHANEKEFQSAECDLQLNENEIALSINSDNPSSPRERNYAETSQNSPLILDLTNDSESVKLECCGSSDPGKISTCCAHESESTIQIEDDEENCDNKIIFPVTDEHIRRPVEVMNMDMNEGKAELLKSFLSKCQQNLNDTDPNENLKQVENAPTIDSINVPESSAVEDDEPVLVLEETAANTETKTASFVKIEPADEEKELEAEKMSLIANTNSSHSIPTPDNEASVDDLLNTSTPNDEDDKFIVLDAAEFSQEEKLSPIESNANPDVTVDDNKSIEKEAKEPLESRDGNCVTSSDTSNRRNQPVSEHVLEEGKSDDKPKLANTPKKPIVKRPVTRASNKSPLYSNLLRKVVFLKKDDEDEHSFNDKNKEEVKRSLSDRFSEKNSSMKPSHRSQNLGEKFAWIDDDQYIDARPYGSTRSAREEYWSERSEPRRSNDQTWQNQRKRTFYSSAEESIDEKRMRVSEESAVNARVRDEDHFPHQKPRSLLSIKINWRAGDPRTVYYKNHPQRDTESSYSNVNRNQNFYSPTKYKRYTPYHHPSNSGNFYSHDRQF